MSLYCTLIPLLQEVFTACKEGTLAHLIELGVDVDARNEVKCTHVQFLVTASV